VAQEVQKVLPELVNKSSDDILSISYGNMSGVIIEAIKELNAKVQDLYSKLDALSK
jgi:hypothetical protein